MSDPFRKVKSGDTLRIPAVAYNAMLDAGVANMRLPNRPSATHGEKQGAFVMVRNESGEPLYQFEVLGIDGPVFDTDSQINAFLQTPVLSGVTPEKDHKGQFVVLQEPAEPGSIVRACIAGFTIARVLVEEPEEEDAEYKKPKSCDIEDGNAYHLKNDNTGCASILWIEDGYGEKWALIRIGHSNKASSLFPVVLEKTGGEAGDHKTGCDFQYDVYDYPESGDALATDIDPGDSDHFYRRPSLGKMQEATFGIALYDDNEELKIVWCNEVIETKSCSDENEEEEDGG